MSPVRNPATTPVTTPVTGHVKRALRRVWWWLLGRVPDTIYTPDNQIGGHPRTLVLHGYRDWRGDHHTVSWEIREYSKW